jgi:hypothetical protein
VINNDPYPHGASVLVGVTDSELEANYICVCVTHIHTHTHTYTHTSNGFCQVVVSFMRKDKAGKGPGECRRGGGGDFMNQEY